MGWWRAPNSWRRSGVVGAVLMVLVLTGCADPDGEREPDRNNPPTDEPAETPEPPSRAGASPSPELDPSPEATPQPPPEPITIAFGGDLHFEGALDPLLDDPDTALQPITSELSAADLTVLNLETAIRADGTRGEPEPKKRYTFQAPPTVLSALAAAGVDAVTMANNHALDFGPTGVTDALDADEAEPDLSVVGIGTDVDEAFAPTLHEVGDTTVALLGASMADDPTADPTAHWAATEDEGGIAVTDGPDRLAGAVQQARRAADVVAVYLHWGVQGERCPSPAQQDMARRLAEAGADIVVGSHAHMVQGAGYLDDTYVAYGLGNFGWYSEGPSGLLTLTVDQPGTNDQPTAGAEWGVTEADWAPARINSQGLPEFVDGADATRMIEQFAELRSCTDLQPSPAAHADPGADDED